MSQDTTGASLLSSLRDTWIGVLDAAPDVGLAVVLMIAGWLVARVVRKIAIRVLRLIRLDELAEKSGVDDFLVQGGVRYTTITLIANALYWIILLTVFMALLDALGVRAARELFGRMVRYLPNVVLVVGILLFGSLIARIVGGGVHTYLRNVGSAAADPLGALARYAVLIFVLFLAAEQLTIRAEVLTSAFQIAFAAVCLAAALAFGLGGRDWAARLIDRYIKK